MSFEYNKKITSGLLPTKQLLIVTSSILETRFSPNEIENLL